MIKTVGIVSLSSGTLGEDFARHELEIGVRRLKAYGLTVRFLPHALMGIDYLREHPEHRAADLLAAFADPEIDMILCAIGGDDTYRLLPYLFEHGELKNAVREKVFLGFSDTTINHLMLHQVGLSTYYGQSFLADVCELDSEMLPYTRRYFEELITTGSIRQVTPSNIWYESREDFSPDRIGKPLPAHRNTGFELLQGPARFSGPILGGCIDSLYDLFDGERYADMPVLCRKYHLFPFLADWRGRLLLLESSEEQISPEKYRKALEYLKETGVFGMINGVLAGKPMDEKYHAEYKRLLAEVIDRPDLPILCNLSVGHALPRCILPFGKNAVVDADRQTITFTE